MRVELLNDIKKIVGDIFPQGFNAPSIIRSSRVLVVSREFFETVWVPWWVRHLAELEFTYFNEGMCEAFAEKASAEFTFMVNKAAAQFKMGEMQGGLWQVRVHLVGGYILNGVKDPVHITNMVALEEKNGSISVEFWEPQQYVKRPLLTPIKDVADNFSVLLSDWIH